MLCAALALMFSVGVRPNVVFRQRTGLGVDECEESDLGDVRGRVTE